MIISGFQKLTLLDYPTKLSAIIFTQGCNFKCSYCQNSDLIGKNDSLISENEIFEYLIKRRKVLDGVVISGGEPTIHKDLKPFIQKIKNLGFLIKLDTNGSNPKILKELIDEKLIDYVAMDIKNTFDKYEDVIKTKTNIDKLKESIEILKKSDIDYEFRTTIIKNFHDLKTIYKLCKMVSGSKYYLQNFEDSERVLDKELIPFSKEELIDIQKKVSSKFSNVYVRGL